MISVAIVYDIISVVLGIIPYIGWLMSIFISMTATAHFYMWTKIKGTKNFNKKLLAGSIIEWIPILNILPAWTAMTVAGYFRHKTDELLGKNLAMVSASSNNKQKTK